VLAVVLVRMGAVLVLVELYLTLLFCLVVLHIPSQLALVVRQLQTAQTKTARTETTVYLEVLLPVLAVAETETLHKELLGRDITVALPLATQSVAEAEQLRQDLTPLTMPLRALVVVEFITTSQALLHITVAAVAAAVEIKT
jgi:hypothetical protein